MGTVGELSTSNPGADVPGVAPEGAPNVCARGADDANTGDEVAQRDISDAESISGDEIRDPRRRNSSRIRRVEIEDHVLTGHASFRSWCASCMQGRGRAGRHQWKGPKEHDGSLVVGLPFLWKSGIESTRLRSNNVKTVQVR